MDAIESLTQIIRPALPADVPSLQRLINGFAARGNMLPRTLNELYENVRDFQLCESEGRVVGCAALHVMWGDLAEMKSLAVAEEAQGRGLGGRLTQAILEEARRISIPRVFALTFRVSFFERQGFRQVDKAALPQKIWGECIRCPKFPHCDEQAVLIDLNRAG